jgi:uncharacterized membrane protein
MKNTMALPTKSGWFLFALAITAFGIEFFLTKNFLSALMPVSATMPGRLFGVYFTGVALIACGLCQATKKFAWIAALVLATVFALLLLVTHLPKLIANPYDPGPWTGAAEILALCGGALILTGTLLDYFPAFPSTNTGNTIYRAGCILFAVALVIFGVQHFMYADFIATIIPTWIPGRVFWAYFVGGAFMAAALSFLISRQVPLAATLLGIMFFLWVIFLHAPRVAASPGAETEWTSLLVALAMGSISFLLYQRSSKQVGL